jgi:hypothetical protein
MRYTPSRAKSGVFDCHPFCKNVKKRLRALFDPVRAASGALFSILSSARQLELFLGPSLPFREKKCSRKIKFQEKSKKNVTREMGEEMDCVFATSGRS